MSNTRTIQSDRTTTDGYVRPDRMTSVLKQSEIMSTARTANILLFDRSGSTSRNNTSTERRKKIDAIKEAISMFIINSPDSAYVSVVSFGDIAEVLFDMQVVGPNRTNMLPKIQSIMPAGATAMNAAFKLAWQQCTKAPTGYTIRIYALTDGIPTDGKPTDGDTLPIAEDLKRKIPNAQIHAIGFGHGNEINEELLKNTASRSASGMPFYYHILEAVKLTGVLKRQSRTLSQ